MGHPCPASDECAIHYNTRHTDPGSGAGAPPQIRSGESRGGFHHRALTEPYVSLSTHTAPSIRPFAYKKPPLREEPRRSLRNVERLCLDHAAPPVTGWPPAKAGYRCPFGPAPLQDFQPYCGQLRPCALHRSIDPHRGHRFGRCPSHQDDRFPRSMQKPVSESRRLRAGCRLGRASGLRPSLSRDDHMTSVSTSTLPFRPFIDGLLSLVSPRRTKAGSGPALSATLTTTALNGSSLQRFASSS